MITDAFNIDKNAYISYLKYTNKKLLGLIDYIQANIARPTVIILLGDHGFRESSYSNHLTKYELMNLNAVFLSDRNYTGFYKGMSNVNQFRVLLNSQLGQHLSLLKDSTILMKQ
jgi:hypothetical protein